MKGSVAGGAGGSAGGASGNGGDLIDHRVSEAMDPDFFGWLGNQNFEFAFNSSNFSDRVLRIEIVVGPVESRIDRDGCSSIVGWPRHRKRRRDNIKKEKGFFF